jgi:flavin-dependent dehydrogenase
LAECDVIVVGAGPAGAIAGLVLARAGARVRIVDRATFPRDKLCGDTVNPGTLAVLRRLGLSKLIDDGGLRVDGMLVTGPRGVAVEGRYPDGQHGRALVRRDMDWALLQQAIEVGARQPRARDPRARDGGRGWTALDARVRTRARAPSPAAETVGDRRVLRERGRHVVAR